MKILKKYIIMTTLLAFSAIALYGCGKNQVKSPEPTTTNAPADSSSSATGKTKTENSFEQSKDSTTDNTVNVTKEGSVEKEGNVVLKQLAFLNQEKTITLSDIVDDETMESLLGKADEIKSHTYSPDDGKNMDQLNGKTILLPRSCGQNHGRSGE